MGMASCVHRSGTARLYMVDALAVALLSSRNPSIHFGGRAQHALDGSPPHRISSQAGPTLERVIEDSTNVGRYRGANIYRSGMVFYNRLVSDLFNCQGI